MQDFQQEQEKERGWFNQGYPYWRVAISDKPVFRNGIKANNLEEFDEQSNKYLPLIEDWSLNKPTYPEKKRTS